jgi:hypothetical protein
MEFNRKADGSLENYLQNNVDDTGMVWAFVHGFLQENSKLRHRYYTLIEKVEQITGLKYTNE